MTACGRLQVPRDLRRFIRVTLPLEAQLFWPLSALAKADFLRIRTVAGFIFDLLYGNKILAMPYFFRRMGHGSRHGDNSGASMCGGAPGDSERRKSCVLHCGDPSPERTE
jgi:hypothetical protein